MKNTITAQLHEIERQENVKVLLACEAGSRAWGVPSKKSDYDVRFIYVHPIERYLSIEEQNDVIVKNQDDNLDFHGWDLKKTLRLLNKSNPSILEWLQSPIVYLECRDRTEQLRDYIPLVFSPFTTFQHYYRMAKRNVDVSIKNEKTAKMYLTILRPILACKWIISYKKVPPYNIFTLVKNVNLTNRFREEMSSILEKKALDVSMYGPDIRSIEELIKMELASLLEASKVIQKNHEINHASLLDSYFLKTIIEIWQDHEIIQKKS